MGGAFRVIRDTDDHWTEFSSACTNVVWRYRACWDHGEAFKKCYTVLAGQEAIYQTERHYFGIYNNAVSAIESMLYSIHALLASSQTLNWPFEEAERKKLLPGYLLKRFGNRIDDRANAESLYRVLEELAKSGYWRACKNKRIRMFHRSRIPRHLSIGGGPPRYKLPATSNTEEDATDIASVERLVDWVSETFAVLCQAGISVIEVCEVGTISEPLQATDMSQENGVTGEDALQSSTSPISGTLTQPEATPIDDPAEDVEEERPRQS